MTTLVKANIVSVSDSITRSRGARFSAAQPAHGHAKQNGEDRDLQNLIVGNRLRDVFRKEWSSSSSQCSGDGAGLQGLLPSSTSRRSVLLGTSSPTPACVM